MTNPDNPKFTPEQMGKQIKDLRFETRDGMLWYQEVYLDGTESQKWIPTNFSVNNPEGARRRMLELRRQHGLEEQEETKAA